MSGIVKALQAVSDGARDLFVLEIGERDVVFRLLSINEASKYAHLLMIADTEPLQNIVYEHIFRSVVVDDYTANHDSEMPAGVPTTIARLVLYLSGADENSAEYTRELVRLYREQLDNMDTYMKRTICQVFPAYTFESISDLNFQDFVNIFLQAEKVLLDRGIINEEHNFEPVEQQKAKSFRVEDLIRQDQQAYDELNKVEDPASMARMAEIREKAIKRAQEEEKNFKRRVRR